MGPTAARTNHQKALLKDIRKNLIEDVIGGNGTRSNIWASDGNHSLKYSKRSILVSNSQVILEEEEVRKNLNSMSPTRDTKDHSYHV